MLASPRLVLEKVLPAEGMSSPPLSNRDMDKELSNERTPTSCNTTYRDALMNDTLIQRSQLSPQLRAESMVQLVSPSIPEQAELPQEKSSRGATRRKIVAVRRKTAAREGKQNPKNGRGARA